MRLLVSFIMVVLVSVYMSCTVGKTINTSRCHYVLNPDTLEVTGTDYDFKDSIYYGCRGISTIVMELLTEEFGQGTINASKNDIKLGYYGLRLCPRVKYCRDTPCWHEFATRAMNFFGKNFDNIYMRLLFA